MAQNSKRLKEKIGEINYTHSKITAQLKNTISKVKIQMTKHF